MRASIVVGLALASGCSYTFDGDAPDSPLLGTPPNMSSFERLNQTPVSGEYQVQGKDGANWIALLEPYAGDGGTLRLRRLSGTPAEQTWSLKNGLKALTFRAFFLLDSFDPMKKAPSVLRIVQAGDSPGDLFTFPPGTFQLSLGGDDLFAYWITEADVKSVDVVHRRTRAVRTIQLPTDKKGKLTIDPTRPAPMYWSGSGLHVFMRDAVDPKTNIGHLESYSTTDPSGEQDYDFGLRPASFYLDESDPKNRKVVTWGMDGIRYAWWDRTRPDTVIEPDPVKPDLFTGHAGYIYYYAVDGSLRRVLADGTMPPEPVDAEGSARIYGFAPGGQLFYSKDPGDRYTAGSGDGWVGPWRFMDRGRDARFDSDGTRVYWLEHTAWHYYTGDLLSARLPDSGGAGGGLGGASERLARNVSLWSELGDGRIIAAANQAFSGVENRIVIIDTTQKNSRYVATAAYDFSFMYGSSDLLVDVLSGASGHSVVRVPLPPMPCPDASADAQAWLDGIGRSPCKMDSDCTVVQTACGMPAACGAAAFGGPPGYTYRLNALIANWKSGMCAPAGCAACPSGPAQKAVCSAGACTLVPK